MSDITSKFRTISGTNMVAFGLEHNFRHSLLIRHGLKRILSRAVESQSESEGILGGVGVGTFLPTPTPTSI
jgi:hypothetical protein